MELLDKFFLFSLIAVLCGQIVMQILICVRPRKPYIAILLVSEVVCILAAFLISRYYDQISANFSHIEHYFYSQFVAYGYIFLFLLSCTICYLRLRKADHPDCSPTM